MLVYFDHPRGLEGFPIEYRKEFTKVWGFMFGKHLFCEDNFAVYLKTRHAHRALLTWKGVVQVPEENVAAFLEDIYERNLPLAKQNIERKKNQSNLAKKRKAEEDSQARSSAQAEAPSSCCRLPWPRSGRCTSSICSPRTHRSLDCIQLRAT